MNSAALKLLNIILFIYLFQPYTFPVIKKEVSGQIIVNSGNEPRIDDVDTNRVISNNNTKDTVILSKIEDQTIKKGQIFPAIILNNYLIKKGAQQNIFWSASGGYHLKVSIDSSSQVSVKSMDESWIGSDTIVFKANYLNRQIDSQLVVFTIVNTSFFNIEPIKPIRKVLNQGVNDILNLVSSPFRWDSTDIMLVPVVLLGTYTFMIGDQSIHNWVSNNGNAKKNYIMDLGTQYGEASFTQFYSLAVISYGLFFKDDDAVTLGLEIFESYFIANNIASIIKRTFGRARPYENKGPYSFNSFPSRANSLNSFPSGHATLAFSLSSVLAAHTKSIWLKSLFFTAAGITAVSRVYYSYHWFSDVFMGSAIGYFVGNYLVNMHQTNSSGNIHFDFDEEGRFSLKFNF